LAFLLAAAPLRAVPEPPAGATAAADFDLRLQSGLRALYNLDYDAARATFGLFAEQFPGDPMGHYALATTDWWELTNEFDEDDPALEARFLDRARRTVELARLRVRESDPLGEARLCLGGALGLIARWEAIEGKWLAAYRHGRQAFKAQKEAVEVNPELYDAYLGVGMFHYYAATLPSVVKVLAKLMFGGNKKQGLDEIRLAMEKGRFSRTAAQLFLVGIYLNTEKDYAAALELIRAGRREFPESPFFHLVEMMALENSRLWEEMRREARDFLARVERGEPFYRRKYLARGHLLLGNSHLVEKRPAAALEEYDLVLRDFPSEDRWITWTHLYRGKALDALGRRAEALEAYRAVRKRRDVWGLHDQAEALIDKPYSY
jgi:tetratricopeptide (TPR) repeat protein